MDYFSVLIGFLMGTATGAAGTYFGNKYTDKRMKAEQVSKEKSIYKKLWKNHRILLEEMKADINNPEFFHHREFCLSKRTWSLNYEGPFMTYHLDVHDALEQQIQILESYGLIIDVSEAGDNLKKYRLKEHFVEHLRET